MASATSPSTLERASTTRATPVTPALLAIHPATRDHVSGWIIVGYDDGTQIHSSPHCRARPVKGVACHAVDVADFAAVTWCVNCWHGYNHHRWASVTTAAAELEAAHRCNDIWRWAQAVRRVEFDRKYTPAPTSPTLAAAAAARETVADWAAMTGRPAGRQQFMRQLAADTSNGSAVNATGSAAGNTPDDGTVTFATAALSTVEAGLLVAASSIWDGAVHVGYGTAHYVGPMPEVMKNRSAWKHQATYTTDQPLTRADYAVAVNHYRDGVAAEDVWDVVQAFA